jgi:hypothetical protein
MTRMRELDELLRKYEDGFYTTLELLPKIVRVSSEENAEQILGQLPPNLANRFRKWVAEFDVDNNYSVVSEGHAEPLPRDVVLKYKELVTAEAK